MAMSEPIKLRDLCIVTMVGLTSDRFGVSPTGAESCTASGRPLEENVDEEAAKQWSHNVVAKHKWMFESKVRLNGLTALMLAPIIRTAFEGDDQAAASVLRIVGGLGVAG
jgi:hypothetical protein